MVPGHHTNHREISSVSHALYRFPSPSLMHHKIIETMHFPVRDVTANKNTGRSSGPNTIFTSKVILEVPTFPLRAFR